MRCLFIAAALSVAMPALAQFSERIDVVAVELPIAVRDRAGKVRSDLTKDDFEVLEDGVRQEVIGLAYAVAYVDASLQANGLSAAKTAANIDVGALRPGLAVESQHSVMTGSPASVTTARATALAMNVGQRGELPITCRIRRGGKAEEELDIRVDLTPFAAARVSMKASILRVAIAVAPDKAYPLNDLQHSDRIDLSSLTAWQSSIPIRGRGNAPAAVVVEEVATGACGGAPCEIQR
jgi:hypothetical protein